MQNTKRHWRNAATLIVLAKQFRGSLSRRDSNTKNFDILLQTRTLNASTFPNSVVFPGGVTEPQDESEHWLRHLRSFGFTSEHFQLLHCPQAPITPILQPDPIRRHISLRITAIRETFEELGILIGSRTHCADKKDNWGSFIIDFDIKNWQHKVSEEPEQFLTLCKELNCYPDIWALYYWSNWLTPTTYQKRFDSSFFVTAFREKPQLSCNTEVAKVKWSSIEEILKQYKKKEVNIYPPQLYELYRLSVFENVEDLINFASKISKYGSELYFPFIISAKDGTVHVLPGDDLYPSDIDLNSGIALNNKDKTVSDLREGCEVLHRVENLKEHTQILWKNFKPLHHINMNSESVEIHS